jgi:hypothetical protein
MLASDSADIGHMAAIAADGQAAFTGNFTLLLRAHGGKPASTLFLTRGG